MLGAFSSFNCGFLLGIEQQQKLRDLQQFGLPPTFSIDL
jgi:hypothetical protein